MMSRGNTRKSLSKATSNIAGAVVPFPDKALARSTSKRPTKTKVLIAHYIGLIRLGVRLLMSASVEGFDLCAETNDAQIARQLFERHRPQVVIVGPTLRGGDGIQLIKDFRKMDPNAAILMLSANEEARSIRLVLHAGALGYLRIFDADSELLTALEKISAGKRYVSRELQEGILDNFATAKVGRQSTIDKLSDREREVLFHIGKGSGPSEIANEMSVSVKTIETHKKRIKNKLALVNGLQLREKAIRWANKCDWKEMVRLHATRSVNVGLSAG